MRGQPLGPRRLDLRLLVPTVLGWVVVAFAGLLVPIEWVWWGGGASAVTAALLAAGSVGDRRGRSQRTRLAAMSLAVLALLLVAAAGHRVVREVGPVATLAGERAVVTLRGLVL
ncbi:MAG: ComEC/Rec2 family competence protein, partial [Terracoccus sp.]